ncbi:MAG: agmatinase [Candidatus Gastranaerophilales bacterium]|nr:agmatinase [Candidatus Gastranaerophilales bacterium]
MLNKNIVNFIECNSEYEAANIVLYGAPFDSTTSFRPGTRFAPQTIRNESYGLETYSPYQNKDLTDIFVFDSGDLELPIGNTEMVLTAIEERAAEILKDNKIPFLIGGEHLVTLGAIRAAVKKYNNLNIIHIDAHADLRDDYLGVKLSHACVMRRCWELTGSGRIYQFGIRSGEKSEFLWANQGHTYMHPFSLNGLKETLEILKGKPIYLTVDLDVLDTSVFSGTGTPEPGGISFTDLMNSVIEICTLNEVIGCDVNELCPVYDQSGVSTAAACKIIREMLLSLSKTGGYNNG